MKGMDKHLYDMVQEEIRRLTTSSRFSRTTEFVQHGTQSVFDHSVAVAHASCLFAYKLHLKVDYRSMIRGALLHDYFLYDWHTKESWHRWHGFRHPYTAWKNARADLHLNRRESNIILRHMFPLTPIPPSCKEGWIVCLADKVCTMNEVAQGLVLWCRKLLFSRIDLLT